MAKERLSLRQKWLLHYINDCPTKIANDLRLQMDYGTPCEGMTDGELRRFLKPLHERDFIVSYRAGFIELSLKGEEWLQNNPTEVGWADLHPKQAAELKAWQEEQRREISEIRHAGEVFEEQESASDYLSAPVAKDPAKKRIEVHVAEELKEALVKLAKADNRSLLNYIETLLDKHVKASKKSKD